ncbi:hypothetical protein H0H87_012498 [Tephrocybe sp. NHM501043]|nr:hypothetical protein H0H87_012498 [Tephrocybe sp. NHM501043]
MSASVPLAKPTAPIFVGGVISCICCVFVGIFATYTVVEGSLDGSDTNLVWWVHSWLVKAKGPRNSSEELSLSCNTINSAKWNPKGVSPFKRTFTWFQSHFSIDRTSPVVCAADVEANDAGQKELPKSWSKFLQTFALPKFTKQHLRPTPNAPPKSEETSRQSVLEAQYHSTYHDVICATHDDDALDHATAALPLILDDRRTQSDGHDIYVTPNEVRTFSHLLSMDVSIRCNLAAADNISRTLVSDKLMRLSGWSLPNN